MREYKLRRGLDLPVAGVPEQRVALGPTCRTAAVIGADYIGLKPRLSVQEGDAVKRGEPLLFHRDTPDVKIVSPVTGNVKAIHRGPRRVLESVVIEGHDVEDQGIDFSSVGGETDADAVATRLAAAGLWTSFRTRPYSKVPDVRERPSAIFVTAMDTEPLSPDAQLIINDSAEAFARGLAAVAKLSNGRTYVCQDVGADIPGTAIDTVEAVGFSGPHPAGLPGTHIHFLHPLDSVETVWSIWYQDVIAIGNLMLAGFLDTSRIVSLCGPQCRQPRLVKTLTGASLTELTDEDRPTDVPIRLVSGSILSGRAATDTTAYLGRYARQVTIMEEDRKQEVLGWIRPMAHKFATQPVLASAFANGLFHLTTNLNGGRRAMVPTGTFETLMPQDYLPTQLLRALLVMDTDMAQALGALELDEEDLGLVGFACPAKYEYGLALRDCLDKIEKEG
ncbi:MAG: Na(+)-translocating NADH-quinone reductase subunit A [Pseudomonadota bacterium]